MSNENAILNAAVEAAYAAQKAREFAALFEKYAKLLSETGGQTAAQQKHFEAMAALHLLKEAVESSNDWVVKSMGLHRSTGRAGEVGEGTARSSGATH